MELLLIIIHGSIEMDVATLKAGERLPDIVSHEIHCFRDQTIEIMEAICVRYCAGLLRQTRPW